VGSLAAPVTRPPCSAPWTHSPAVGSRCSLAVGSRCSRSCVDCGASVAVLAWTDVPADVQRLAAQRARRPPRRDPPAGPPPPPARLLRGGPHPHPRPARLPLRPDWPPL